MWCRYVLGTAVHSDEDTIITELSLSSSSVENGLFFLKRRYTPKLEVLAESRTEGGQKKTARQGKSRQ